MDQFDELWRVFAIIVFILVCYKLRHGRRRLSRSAFGTAMWCSRERLKKAGMLQGTGVILGRTEKGEIIRINDGTHGLCIGGTGAGKGVSVMVVNMLAAKKHCSMIVFDTKGDLGEIAEKRLGKIIRLAPYTGGNGSLNPLDMIPKNSPLFIDYAAAIADSLVIRGEEREPHWNDRASQTIQAIIVWVLIFFDDKLRNLNTVQEIASNHELLFATAKGLCEIGGIPGRLGAQLKTLFDTSKVPVVKDGKTELIENTSPIYSREGTSAIAVVLRHLAFLNSNVVARAVATSSFNPKDLKKHGLRVFIQIPPDFLDSAKGLLRCWTTTLIRAIGLGGGNEILCLFDEASALGGLAAVKEALIRGRSAGVRMLLAYQSDSQVRSAFPQEQSLLYDNCDYVIYLPPSPRATQAAEELSKTLGEWTQEIESYGDSYSRSYQERDSPGGANIGHSGSTNVSIKGRPLMTPTELLQMDRRYLIALVKGLPPVWVKRIIYYRDPAFNRLVSNRLPSFLWLFLIGMALVIWFILAR